MAKKNALHDRVQNESLIYTPVVTVLGHVDHGKTSLLDAIRKTSIAQKEHGGITQKIGASSIEIVHEKQRRRVTFIDTPGHETFLRMRSRGAQVADLALLVVSSTDGVMPQTKESIDLLKKSNLTFIVVLTKADLPDKNIEKIKQQLEKLDVLLEGRGGNTPVIEVSSKTGENIKALLDLILLAYDMRTQVKEEKIGLAQQALRAVVIESWLDAQAGPRVSIVVKSGNLKIRDTVFCEGEEARVRTLINAEGKFVESATVGDGVEMLGFQKVLPVGSIVTKKGEDSASQAEQEPVSISKTKTSLPAEQLAYKSIVKESPLALILRADTLGSLEAVLNSLPKEIKVISANAGEISQADVLLAKSSRAIVLGFNTKLRDEIKKQALLEKVLVKNYSIIYELLDEVSDVLAGREIVLEEKIFGKAKILARFPYEKTFVAGVKVAEGRVAKGDKVRLVRDETTLGEATITSLRHGKDSVSKVEAGEEAGVVISPFLDFTIGDMLICHG